MGTEICCKNHNFESTGSVTSTIFIPVFSFDFPGSKGNIGREGLKWDEYL